MSHSLENIEESHQRQRTQSLTTTTTNGTGPSRSTLPPHPPSSFARRSQLSLLVSTSPPSPVVQPTASEAASALKIQIIDFGASSSMPSAAEDLGEASPNSNPSSSSSGSTKTVKASHKKKLAHKRSWSDPPYASTSISISPETAVHPSPSQTHRPTPTITPRVSFANDPSHRVARRAPSPSSPTTASPYTWPRSALKTSTTSASTTQTPDLSRSPDTVASSRSPETPRTPSAFAMPLRSTERRPRHHHSYETGVATAANSRPFSALSFTSPEPYQTPPTLKTQRKSSPGLLTSYELPSGQNSQPSGSKPAQRPLPRSPRQSAPASGRTRSHNGGWETKVTEELLRLAKVAPIARPDSNAAPPRQETDRERRRSKPKQPTSSSDQHAAPSRTTRHSRRPSAPAQAPVASRTEDYRPRRRSKPLAPKQQHPKLSALFDDPPQQEPVIVHVVRQDSYDDQAIDPYTIPLDIPSPNLGLETDDILTIQSRTGSDKSKKSRDRDSLPLKGKSSSESNGNGNTPRAPEGGLLPGTTNRERKRSLRPKPKSGGSGALATGAATTTGDAAPEEITPRSPRPSGSSQISTSLPSMRRPATESSPSKLRPSPSHPVLTRPSTPPANPRARTQSHPKLTESPSAADSLSSTRKRLSSSVYAGSLFFTPRANPPEGYVPTPLTNSEDPAEVSSPSQRTSAAETALTHTSPPSIVLVPGQVRLVEARREEEAASLGKGKGKRLGSDDGLEDLEDVKMSPEMGLKAGYAPSQTSRQRKESIMTSDDDVLGELPFNPRKRIKLSTSAALVHSLTMAAEAEQRQASEGSDAPQQAELRGILTNKGTMSSQDDIRPTQHHSRPDSRRSANVSFSVDETPPATPTDTRARSRASTRYPALPPPPTKTSIPLMAFISPRPASTSTPSPNWGGYHLREPKRYSAGSQMAAEARRASRISSSRHTPSPMAAQYDMSGVVHHPPPPWYDALPFQGWAFFAGFVFPLFWWAVALSKANVASDVETGHTGPLVLHTERHVEMIVWRRRCRLMSIFSILVYVPVITLAIVFGR